MSFIKLTLVTVLIIPILATNACADSLISSSGDRQEISVTIYNSNLGMVNDRRTVHLPSGITELKFMDVATQISPATVRISAINGPPLQILEQNYEYDLINPQKLMDKYVGKELRLYQKNPYTEREEEVSATLLSNNGAPVFRIGKDITFNHPGRVIFPEIPPDIIARPTLVWLLEGKEDGDRRIEATYLTSGITWKADYVLTLDKTGSRADLTGWVTIDNRSGATYRNATLKLVAGDLNRVREDRQKERLYKSAMADVATAPQFREEGLFEYHLYTLQRSSTIKENQTKQIALLAAEKVPVHRDMVLKTEQGWYGAPHGGEGARHKVGVFVEFDNRQTSGLGMPLPKGTIRIYQPDSLGGLQFIGEDAIEHTPQDEKVRVKVGDAFDLAATRKQTDWKKLANDTYEAGWEIVIRNHKKEEVSVRVLEPMAGEWQVLKSSHPVAKPDAQTAEFIIPVKEGGETKLTYRVRVRY